METGAAGIQCRWNLSSILKHRSCIWFTNEGNVIFLFMYFCLGWFSFFTCQFFCIPLEALVLGDISLFIYTLWNSYVTNTTIFWMLQFFLQDQKSLSYVVSPSACPTMQGKNSFVYLETKGHVLLLNVNFTLVKIKYTKICSTYW